MLKNILLGLAVIATAFTAQAQDISGPTIVSSGSMQSYTYTGSTLGKSMWTVQGGTITYEGASAEVEWGSSTTNGIVNFLIWQYNPILDTYTYMTEASLNVEIIMEVPAPTGSIDVSGNDCGDKQLTSTGTPPQGIEWYWREEIFIPTTPGGNELFQYPATNPLNVDESGTYYLFAYDTNTENWSGDYLSIGVNVSSISPGGIGGDKTICGGGSVGTISNIHSATNSAGSFTYNWSSRPINGTWTQISGEHGATLSPGTLSSPREFQRWVRDDNGTNCTKYSNIVRISIDEVSQAGTVSGATEEFGASSGTLSHSGATGSVLKWQKREHGNTWSDISSTSNTLNYSNVTKSTDYRVYVTNGVCPADDSDFVTVTVHSIPSLSLNGPENISPGESTQLVIDEGFYKYTWYFNGVQISGNNLNILDITKPGRYKVSVQSSNGGPTYTTGEYIIGFAVEQQNLNYITTIDFLREDVSRSDDLFSVGLEDYQLNTEYFDELGRTMQVVQFGSSNNGNDIIIPYSYDKHGRMAKEYLPFSKAVRKGIYQQSAFSDQSNFYLTEENVSHTDSAYSRKVFERSPLNRVVEQGAPGEPWQPSAGNALGIAFDVNENTENILEWYYDASNSTLELLASYPSNQLVKKITTDEADHKVIEFVDKFRNTILKRVQTNQVGAPEAWADTYYVYDDFGNLIYVLPPEAVAEIGNPTIPYVVSVDLLNRWAFQYKYDHRNRMIEKKVPGAKPVYMIYDDRDRLVLTQDGNQRLEDKWSFTKYGALNRPVSTGIYTHTTSLDQSDMQDVVDTHYNAAPATTWYEEFDGTAIHGYTDRSFPIGVAANDYLTVTYYDNYAFKSLTGFDASYDYDETQLGSESTPQGDYTYPSSHFERVKGQATGSKTKVLDGSNTWLKSVTYYDNRYRVIQTVTENYGGTIDRLSTLYNFPGWVLATFTSHETGSQTIGIKKRYTYDHAGRLMKGYHEIYNDGAGQGEVLLAENKYNELGELIEKNLHVENGTSHQSIDYRYNIRGWLERVNTSDLQTEPGETDTPDLFGMELLYNNPLNGVPVN